MSEQMIEVGELVCKVGSQSWIDNHDSTPQLQTDCKWVKVGWAIQPTDFFLSSTTGERIIAGDISTGADCSWNICMDEHLWQRPKLLDTDLLYLMKCIKTVANSMPEIDKQKFIWEMLQVQSQAGKLLSQIRERVEAAAKAHRTGPDIGLLEQMAEIEDSSRSISVGGLVSDMGMLTKGGQP